MNRLAFSFLGGASITGILFFSMGHHSLSPQSDPTRQSHPRSKELEKKIGTHPDISTLIAINQSLKDDIISQQREFKMQADQYESELERYRLALSQATELANKSAHHLPMTGQDILNTVSKAIEKLDQFERNTLDPHSLQQQLPKLLAHLTSEQLEWLSRNGIHSADESVRDNSYRILLAHFSVSDPGEFLELKKITLENLAHTLSSDEMGFDMPAFRYLSWSAPPHGDAFQALFKDINRPVIEKFANQAESQYEKNKCMHSLSFLGNLKESRRATKVLLDEIYSLDVFKEHGPQKTFILLSGLSGRKSPEALTMLKNIHDHYSSQSEMEQSNNTLQWLRHLIQASESVN